MIKKDYEEMNEREAFLMEREALVREREKETLAHYHAIEARASASAARLHQARLEISMGAAPAKEILLKALLGDLDLDVLARGSIAPPSTYLRASELAQRWGTSIGALAQLRYRNTGPAYVNIQGVGIRYNLTVVEEYEAREIVKPAGAEG